MAVRLTKNAAATKKAELTNRLELHRLVAVVRSKSAEEALRTARAASDAGVWFVEITFSVPGALDVIKELAVRRDLFVGAGTVLTKKDAERAIAVGARFMVSPTLETALVPVCSEAGAVCIIGAATPTEILAAARAGADLVKIFPADCVGGPRFIRQMLGPFPEIRFLVSGGVERSNVGEYVRLGVTGICLGSAMLASLLAQKDHRGLADELRLYVRLVKETKAQQSLATGEGS